MSDSSTGGYLQAVTVPTYDEQLEDLFHAVIAGITGIPPSLVRPKYQDEPPNWPAFDVDWCAFSVFVMPTIWNAYKTLNTDQQYTVEGTEVLEVTVSFYGPHYQANERAWRDGIQVEQNRDELIANKIAFISFADPVVVPVLLKQKWVRKVDVRGTFHRWVARVYDVRSFVSADGTIRTDQTPQGEVIATITTDPPPSP